MLTKILNNYCPADFCSFQNMCGFGHATRHAVCPAHIRHRACPAVACLTAMRQVLGSNCGQLNCGQLCLSRSSAYADKPARRTQRSVKVTKHSTIPYARYFSSCAIVTLFLRRALSQIFDFKKCRDLEIRVRGHSRSLKVVPFYRLGVVSYQCSIETLSAKRTVFEIFDFKNAVTLKTGLRVRQGHWKCHHAIEHI